MAELGGGQKIVGSQGEPQMEARPLVESVQMSAAGVHERLRPVPDGGPRRMCKGNALISL